MTKRTTEVTVDTESGKVTGVRIEVCAPTVQAAREDLAEAEARLLRMTKGDTDAQD